MYRRLEGRSKPALSERGGIVKIVIVEDQVMLRELLVLYLDVQEGMEVAAALGDASQALEAVESSGADIVLMDICTECGNSGIVAARDIRESRPEVRIVLMTGTRDISHMGHARQVGADGFIYKDSSLKELLATLRFAHEGYTVFPSNEYPGTSSVRFNRDEVRLLRLICEGCSRRQIAQELCVSEGTVKRKVGELLAKTGYENVFKLAVVAIAKGYIDPRVKRCELRDDMPSNSSC